MPKKPSPTKTKKGKTGGKPKRLVLLDAHAIIHRAYHALPDFTSATGEPTGALYGLAAMLLKIIADLKPDYIAAAYDLPKPTHRHIAYEKYKATRKELEEPLVAQLVRSRDVFKAFSIPIYDREEFEADDILGTIVEMFKDDSSVEIVIASGDMDTLQLVSGARVKVFTLRKGIQDTILYDESDVEKRFGFPPVLLPDYKGLRGDPSDNIPGIAGIGEKTATTLITTFGDLDALYKTLAKGEEKFLGAGITKRIVGLLKEGEEEARFSKLLATIRRDAPITFTLPDTVWREHVSVSEIVTLFTELGFRSLVARAKEAFPEINQQPTTNNQQQIFYTEPTTSLSHQELTETKVALWLLNSEITNPTEEDIKYFARTDDIKKAREHILSEVQKQGLTDVFEKIEKPLTPVLEKMHERGVRIDTSYLSDIAESYHAELDALKRKIFERAGMEFNLNSPRQLGDVLFTTLGLTGGKKTSTGQRSTRESELAKLADKHPIIGEILQHRELQKLLSTYIDAFPKLLGPDGRLHTTFVQTGAATGRMSSQNPNLQNIPIKTERGRAVRGAFVACPGFVLATFDYSQIELRIAAILSQDEKLLKTFSEGGDIHTAVASEIFNVPQNDVTQTMRRTAKVINFGIIYGMGANALAATAGMSRKDAQKYLAEYEKTFPTLSRWIETLFGEVRKKGYTETLFGRRRHLPGIRSPLPYIQAEAERQAVNAPIQGTSADIIKRSMVEVDEYIAREKLDDDVFAILQIHDELMYEIREGVADKVVPEIKKIMEAGLRDHLPAGKAGETYGVPIVVDASVGTRWGEMKKVNNKKE
ncbi:MAG: DNA polymerase [Patescibacteria group bacterium]